MKNRTPLLLLFCLLTISSLAQRNNQEPATNLEISVNGNTYEIREGDTLHLPNNEIVVKTARSKTFNFGLLRFSYPSFFAFEFEEDIAYKNWSLDGNDFVIMYFEIGTDLSLEEFVESISDQFGQQYCKVSSTSRKLGSRKLKGKHLDIDILGQKLTYDIYDIESSDGSSHFLAFQDSKNDDGSDSSESLETLKMIDETITYR